MVCTYVMYVCMVYVCMCVCMYGCMVCMVYVCTLQYNTVTVQVQRCIAQFSNTQVDQVSIPQAFYNTYFYFYKYPCQSPPPFEKLFT